MLCRSTRRKNVTNEKGKNYLQCESFHLTKKKWAWDFWHRKWKDLSPATTNHDWIESYWKTWAMEKYCSFECGAANKCPWRSNLHLSHSIHILQFTLRAQHYFGIFESNTVNKMKIRHLEKAGKQMDNQASISSSTIRWNACHNLMKYSRIHAVELIIFHVMTPFLIMVIPCKVRISLWIHSSASWHGSPINKLTHSFFEWKFPLLSDFHSFHVIYYQTRIPIHISR